MADRDFDAEFDYENVEGHTFTLGGYRFNTPPVAPPGAFLAAGRGLVAATRFLRRMVLPDQRADLERVLESPDTSATLIDLAPELLTAVGLYLAALDAEVDQEVKAGQQAALEALREIAERASQPEAHAGPRVSAYEIDTVSEWLMEVSLGRPTESPSPFGNGEGRTSNGSKAISRRPAKAGKT